jgi:phospholipid/cholesterol/gamma-HCH transport system permease protein
MTMATTIVLVGCYYGYNAGGGPVWVGEATAKSMVLNLVLVTLIGMLGTQVFWGTNPHSPIGGRWQGRHRRREMLSTEETTMGL